MKHIIAATLAFAITALPFQVNAGNGNSGNHVVVHNPVVLHPHGCPGCAWHNDGWRWWNGNAWIPWTVAGAALGTAAIIGATYPWPGYAWAPWPGARVCPTGWGWTWC